MWASWVHHSWRIGQAEALREVGPEMPERGSKTSMVPVVWATFGIFFRSDPNEFLRWLVTTDETWLYHYDPEKKQQSMEWRHSGSPHPKKFRVQKSAGKSSPRFFGIKTASSSFIIFQRAKLSKRGITHLCWCNLRTFWRKNATGRSPRGSCSCTTMPRLPGYLQPRRKWPTWASNVLITHPILSPNLAPSDYHIFPGLKQQLKGRNFSSDAEVIAAAETWLEGQRSEFFWVAYKSYCNGIRSVLSFVGSMLNKSRIWSLWLVSFLVGLRT